MTIYDSPDWANPLATGPLGEVVILGPTNTTSPVSVDTSNTVLIPAGFAGTYYFYSADIYSNSAVDQRVTLFCGDVEFCEVKLHAGDCINVDLSGLALNIGAPQYVGAITSVDTAIVTLRFR